MATEGKSESTDVSLKEFLLALMKERDQRYEQRFAGIDKILDKQDEFARITDITVAMNASEKAILKAETATERRFESVNEFRSQLADQQITFVRKPEVDLRFKAQARS